MYMEEDIVEPLIEPGASNATSHKPWASGFNAVDSFILYDSTKATFDAIFGPLLPDDTIRLNYDSPEPPEEQEFVNNEADVTRLFQKQISGAVMPAWRRPDYVVELSQRGPWGNTSFPGLVDTQFVKTASENESVYALAIG
jgi:hypothetical protein